MRVYIFELVFLVMMVNVVLKRVRGLFDEELKRGIIMMSMYRSGINIKCMFFLSVYEKVRMC